MGGGSACSIQAFLWVARALGGAQNLSLAALCLLFDVSMLEWPQLSLWFSLPFIYISSLQTSSYFMVLNPTYPVIPKYLSLGWTRLPHPSRNHSTSSPTCAIIISPQTCSTCLFLVLGAQIPINIINMKIINVLFYLLFIWIFETRCIFFNHGTSRFGYYTLIRITWFVLRFEIYSSKVHPTRPNCSK